MPDWTQEAKEKLREDKAAELAMDKSLITDEKLDEYIRGGEREGEDFTKYLGQPSTPEEHPESQTPELPESLRDLYIRKPSDDDDPWKPESPLHPFLKKAIDKPGALSDPSHPLHPLFREPTANYTRSQQRAAELERENAALRAQIVTLPKDSVVDDPSKGIYGGISLEAIRNGDDIEHTEVDHLRAQMDYEKREAARIANESVLRQQRELEAQQDRAERSEFLAKTPDGNPEELLEIFAFDVLEDGKTPNPKFKPPTYEELHLLHQVRNGKLIAADKSEVEAAYERGRVDAYAKINEAGGKLPVLRSGDGAAPKPPSTVTDPFSNPDGSLMTGDQIAQLRLTNRADFDRRMTETIQLQNEGKLNR